MVNKIILSRTDNIGDVLLTIPMAGYIKKQMPNVTIAFLGKAYTQPLIEQCSYIDEFHDWDKLKSTENPLGYINANAIVHVFPNKDVARAAKKAKIAQRIGTSHRLFHLNTCNKLVNFTRKKSDLHEAQLNTMLLRPLGLTELPELSELGEYYGWKVNNSKSRFAEYLPEDKFNLIFHMKSKGSAKEWPPNYYLELANSLKDLDVNVIISGTEDEGQLIKNESPELLASPNVTYVAGKFSLHEFIMFISSCDGLLACSTGPLHIASAAGIHALGLYPNERPMHPGRWAPIGTKAQFIEEQMSVDSNYLAGISVREVKTSIEKWLAIS